MIGSNRAVSVVAIGVVVSDASNYLACAATRDSGTLEGHGPRLHRRVDQLSALSLSDHGLRIRVERTLVTRHPCVCQ